MGKRVCMWYDVVYVCIACIQLICMLFPAYLYIKTMQGCTERCGNCGECLTHTCWHKTNGPTECGKFMGCVICTDCDQCKDNYTAWLENDAPIKSFEGLQEVYDRERQEMVVRVITDNYDLWMTLINEEDELQVEHQSRTYA